MSQPLAGIRIVDFTAMVAGPLATRYLADCGADVIKVEPPEGDLMRGAEDARRFAFGQLNAGKKSVVADLKSPGGVAAVRALIATADIVVENFQPDVMARFGLGYAALAPDHPRLIYCSISGFGQDGPMSRRPAYAPVVHAYAGLDQVLGKFVQPGGPPLTHNVMFADVVAGLLAFGAIQTALLNRERHGTGSHVDVSLLDGTMQLMSLHYLRAQAKAPDPPITVYAPIHARDGYVVIPLIAPRAVLKVVSLVRGAGAEAAWAAAGASAIPAAREDIVPDLAAWVAARDCGEIDQIMREAGVPCAIHRDAAEVWSDPQSRFREAFDETSDDTGAFEIFSTPFRLSAATLSAGTTVPRLGRDTQELLAPGNRNEVARDPSR